MFGNSARAKTRDIETPGPDYPEANPEYPVIPEYLGANPEYPGFPRLQKIGLNLSRFW